MHKEESKFAKLINYGGVSREEYKSILPLIDKSNNFVLRAVFLALEVLSILLLIGSILLPSFDSLIIPFSILIIYCLIASLVYIVGIGDDHKVILGFTYLSTIVIAGIFIYAAIFAAPGTGIVALAIVLVLLGAFFIDRPWRMGVVYIIVMTVYSLLSLFIKILPSDDSSFRISQYIEMAYVIIASIIGFMITILLHYIRIPPFFATLHAEKERDTDALTGVQNSIAYDHAVGVLNNRMRRDLDFKVAIAVFDINDLKVTNDNFGHQEGDKLIIRCSEFISSYFVNSTVYRIGGDEFVVILAGDDLKNKDKINLSIRDKIIEMNDRKDSSQGDVSLAVGFAYYDRKIDRDYVSLFSRADADMYENKKFLKGKKTK